MRKSAAVLLLLLAAGFIWKTEEAINAAFAGLSLAVTRVVPALLPLSVLAGTAVRMGLLDGLNRKLAPAMAWFGLPGAATPALVLGLAGGYPLGAQVIAQLHAGGRVSKRQAEIALGFCNNAGPAFILGVAGAGVFQSRQTGFFLLLVHMGGAVLAGLLLARFSPKEPFSNPAAAEAQAPESFGMAFTNAVQSSALALVRVVFFIGFFTFLARMLALLPLPIPTAWMGFLQGLLELSGGLALLSKGQEPMAAFLLGFGGLCVYFQTAAAFGTVKISMKRYGQGKLLHGALSMALYMALIRFPILLGILALFGAIWASFTGKAKRYRV